MVASAQPRTEFASTLPGRYYWDPDIYERERERSDENDQPFSEHKCHRGILTLLRM